MWFYPLELKQVDQMVLWHESSVKPNGNDDCDGKARYLGLRLRNGFLSITLHVCV